MNLNQTYYKQYENISQLKIFTSGGKSHKFSHVVAKSTTERGNSNNLQLANTSTPFYNRAFFVRSTRTPRERLNIACSPTFLKKQERECQPKEYLDGTLSMVACNGKGSPFAVFQLSQFSTPLHVTAQTVESLAVAFSKSQLELSAMIYTYLCADRNADTYTENRITIHADSEQNARFQLSARYRLVLSRPIAKFAENQANLTVCKGGLYA